MLTKKATNTSLELVTLKRRGNLGRVNFTKTSGTVTKDMEKNWPIADRRVTSNHPRNNCGTHFGSRGPFLDSPDY